MKIIRITAMWCMSCLVMRSVWDKVFKEYSDLDIVDYDFDDDETEVKKLNPGKVLPVLIIYDKDQEIGRIIGEKSKKELFKIINRLREENPTT